MKQVKIKMTAHTESELQDVLDILKKKYSFVNNPKIKDSKPGGKYEKIVHAIICC